MDDAYNHANKLITSYKTQRSMYLAKQHTRENKDEYELFLKTNRYNEGLKVLSNSLNATLDIYLDVITGELPEIGCSKKILSFYPNDLNIIFIIHQHSIRIFTRISKLGEDLNGLLVDGILYIESYYKNMDRKLESYSGLCSDIDTGAWGFKNENDEFIFFMKDTFPNIIEKLWNNATFQFIHHNNK